MPILALFGILGLEPDEVYGYGAEAAQQNRPEELARRELFERIGRKKTVVFPCSFYSILQGIHRDHEEYDDADADQPASFRRGVSRHHPSSFRRKTT